MVTETRADVIWVVRYTFKYVLIFKNQITSAFPSFLMIMVPSITNMVPIICMKLRYKGTSTSDTSFHDFRSCTNEAAYRPRGQDKARNDLHFPEQTVSTIKSGKN